MIIETIKQYWNDAYEYLVNYNPLTNVDVW